MFIVYAILVVAVFFVYPPLGIAAGVIMALVMAWSASDPINKVPWPHDKL